MQVRYAVARKRECDMLCKSRSADSVAPVSQVEFAGMHVWSFPYPPGGLVGLYNNADLHAGLAQIPSAPALLQVSECRIMNVDFPDVEERIVTAQHG